MVILWYTYLVYSDLYIVVLLLTHLCVTFVPTEGVESNMSSLRFKVKLN